jgi:hypothetical protein
MAGRLTLLRYVALSLFGVFLIVMAYGIYYFPDAPIRYANGQYVGKFGRTHSREHLEHLHTWERIFFPLGIATTAVGIADLAKRRAGRR